LTEETVVEVEETTETEEITKTSVLEKFQIQSKRMFIWTVIYAIIGALLYVAISLIPIPFTMVSILKFGLLPAITIIALVGAIRGPFAGLLAGYLGEVLYGLLVYNVIVTSTLPALAMGLLGFVVGLATYDFTNGRSLVKLSILSVVGFLFTILLSTVIGLTVEGYATMAAIAFSMLPLLTMGIPTALFLTPVLARIWESISSFGNSLMQSE
jgi:hypothetical protein